MAQTCCHSSAVPIMAGRTPLIVEPDVEEFFAELERMAAHPLHGERVERVVRRIRNEQRAAIVTRSDGTIEPKAASDLRMRNAEIVTQVRLYTSTVVYTARVETEQHAILEQEVSLEVWRLMGRSRPFTLQSAYEMVGATFGVSIPTVKKLCL